MASVKLLIRQNPAQVALYCAVGAIVGLLATVFFENWLHNEAPVRIVPTHATLSADGRWLTVEQDLDINCSRDTSYLIYPDDPRSGIRHYISLGSSKNGLPYPGAVPHYTVSVPIPAGLEGDYWYVERSSETCWPPLFLSHWNASTTPPLLLHLGSGASQ